MGLILHAVKSNVRLPKERSQQECNAGPEFKVDIERVEVRGCFVGSGFFAFF